MLDAMTTLLTDTTDQLFRQWARRANTLLVPVQLLVVAQLFRRVPLVFPSWEIFSRFFYLFYGVLLSFLIVLFLATLRVPSLRKPISGQMLLHQSFLFLFWVGDFLRCTVFDTEVFAFNPYLHGLLLLFVAINTFIFIYVRGFMSKTGGEQRLELLQAFTKISMVSAVLLLFFLIGILVRVNLFTSMNMLGRIVVVLGLVAVFFAVYVDIRTSWMEKAFDRRFSLKLLASSLFFLFVLLLCALFLKFLTRYTWESIIIASIFLQLSLAAAIALNEIGVNTGGVLWAVAHFPILGYYLLLMLLSEEKGLITRAILSFRSNLDTIVQGGWFVVGAALSTLLLRLVVKRSRMRDAKKPLNKATVMDFANSLSIDLETAKNLAESQPFASWAEVALVKGIGKKRLAYLQDHFAIE